MSEAQREAEWIERSAGVRVLDARLVRGSDEDARAWLSGQITNDIRALSTGDATYALALDVHGKILADLWVIDRGEDLALIVPAEATSALLEHFEKYIVMEDVELEALDDLAVVTVQGPGAEALRPEGVPAYPCDRLGTGGFDLVIERSALDETVAALEARARAIGGGPISATGFELARLRRGVPAFGVDFGPSTLPQEAGLAARAVSFDKGCYLGQEVVCMLENRGKLRRRLVRLAGEGDLEPGTELREGDASVGAITSAARDGDRVRALGLVKSRVEVGQALSSEAGTLLVEAVVGA